jgi:hypothetical protein
VKPLDVKWYGGPYIDPAPRDPWGEPYLLSADGRTIGVSLKSVWFEIARDP